MRIILTIMFVALPVAAIAEECKTTPYTKIFKCTAATIVLEGNKYKDDSMDCSDVPVSKEIGFYSNSKGTHLPLTSVNTLLANDEDFSRRVWMVNDVKCTSANTVIISYFGGGNCVGCERIVRYTFGSDGELKDARLPKPKSNRTWMLSEKCLGFELALSDKFSEAGYKAKYVVKTGEGTMFVAERNIPDGDPNPSEASRVSFPNDFVYEKTPQLKASMNCSDGKYSWYIYGNGELVDKGKYSFIREGVEEKY